MLFSPGKLKGSSDQKQLLAGDLYAFYATDYIALKSREMRLIEAVPGLFLGVNLIKTAAIGKVILVGLGPAAKRFFNSEQVQLG